MSASRPPETDPHSSATPEAAATPGAAVAAGDARSARGGGGRGGGARGGGGPGESHARTWTGPGWGFVVKLLIMMVINAIGVLAIMSAYAAGSWVVLTVLVVLLALADWIYFSRRALRSEERRVGKEWRERWAPSASRRKVRESRRGGGWS